MRKDRPKRGCDRLSLCEDDILADCCNHFLEQRGAVHRLRPRLGLGQIERPSLAGDCGAIAARGCYRGAERRYPTPEPFGRGRQLAIALNR